MINQLNELENKVYQLLKENGIELHRHKRTVDNNSIYLFTEKGTIRLSDHNNPKSISRCTASIILPIKKEIVERIIKIL